MVRRVPGTVAAGGGVCSHAATGPAHDVVMAHTHHPERHGTKGAGCSGTAERMSAHRTSQGVVIYERCACGRPMMRLERWH